MSNGQYLPTEECDQEDLDSGRCVCNSEYAESQSHGRAQFAPCLHCSRTTFYCASEKWHPDCDVVATVC